MAAKRKRLGKLPLRYRFALNTFPDVRWSRCPRCEKLTFNRKFPLLIFVAGHEPIVLGMTCRYCAGCEFIVCHQHELEAELVLMMASRAPEVIGNEYVVMSVVERKTWDAARTSPIGWDDLMQHTADIKQHFNLSDPRRIWAPDPNRKRDP